MQIKHLLSILIILSSTTLFAQKYVQVWGDEFNTPGLPDSTKWNYEVGKLRNNELQYYTSKRMENVRIEDTVLIIEARKENFEGAQYTSGSIISKGIGDWKYGKFEIRAKVPGGKGTWPAIWMLPTNKEYGAWPKSGELDIMEYIGVEPQNLFYTAHFEGINANGHASSGSGATHVISNPYEKFITFTFIWTPEKIEWFADNIKFHQYTKTSDDYRIWPFNKEFYMILNLAYGGEWGGYNGVDDTKLPHKFYIDYVRVYQLQESEGPFNLIIEPVEGGTVVVSPEMESYPEGTEVTLTAIPDEKYKFMAWKNFSGANPFTFTINKNTTITPYFKDKSQLLTNGNFDESSSPWSFYVNDQNTTSYSYAIENGKFVVNITKSPGTEWKLGFQELGLSLQKGQYRLTFDAYADQAKSVALTVSRNYGDYGPHISKNIPVSTSDKSYELILDMPKDDDNVRLYFGIGTFTGKFYIDNIKLSRIEGNPPTGVKSLNFQNDDLKIYPNPNTGSFRVKIPGFISGQNTVLQLYNLNGKLILQKEIYTTETEFNAMNLTQGIYLIQVNSSQGIKNGRLIIHSK